MLSAAQFLIAMDYSIVYVAMPGIGDGLALPDSSVHWVVSGYATFFSGFLVVGGRAVDRFGARRLFLGALLLFGLTGLAAGLATDPTQLLGARAVQGIAAAVLQPAIIALVNITFPAGAGRGRALSVWGAVGASGLAAGAILGGALTTYSWRWVFLVNLPLAVVCVAAGVWLLQPTAPLPRTVLNVWSAVLCTAAVLLLVLGLSRAAAAGWSDTTTAVGLAVALALSVAFVLQERRHPRPLVDRQLRTTRTLVVGCVAAALYMASVGNEFYVVTRLLQERLAYPPLLAGLAFLPLVVTIMLGNMAAGKVIGALGIRTSLALAFAVDAAGLLLLAFQVSGGSYGAHVLPGLVISGIGHGMTYTSMFVVGTWDVADHHQGVGSALVTTAQYGSGALGMAVLVLVLDTAPDASRYQWGFLTTAFAAAAGCAVAWFGLTTVPWPRARPRRPTRAARLVSLARRPRRSEPIAPR